MPENIEENLAQARDIENPEVIKRESGLELVENKSTRDLVDAADKIAMQEQADGTIVSQDLLDLERALKGIKIDFGSESFTPDELKKDPSIKENIKIWNKMKRGDFYFSTQLTRINPEILRMVMENHQSGINLPNLTSFSEECAKILEHYDGHISLRSVKELSDQALEYLCHHDGGLDLYSLETLSDNGALSLNNAHPVIDLSSLKNISEQGCIYLAKLATDGVHLSGDVFSRVDKYRSRWTKAKRWWKYNM